MKKILSVLVALLVAALLCVPAFAADGDITINPSVKEAAVGDTITISFDVKEGLTGVDAVLKYDASYLEYVKGSAAATDLMTTELNDTNAGEIAVASACKDPCAAGTLFTAQFKVKKANAQISADLNEVLDANENDIAPSTTVAPVTIGEKASSDEKTTGSSDEKTTKSSSNDGGSNGGGNSINPPKTGNTPVIGSAIAVFAASAAVLVTMKKRHDD